MNLTGRQTQRYSASTSDGRLQPTSSRPGAPKGTEQAKIPPRKTWWWFLLALVANFLLMRVLIPGAEEPVTVPYTLFKEEVRKGNVQAIYSRGETITGRFKAPVTYPPAGGQKYGTRRRAPTGERAWCSLSRPAQNRK